MIIRKQFNYIYISVESRLAGTAQEWYDPNNFLCVKLQSRLFPS